MFDKHLDPGIDGITTEQFGVMVTPKCNRCKKCKSCTVDMQRLSRLEQRELEEIENNLELDPIEKCWKTKYPYRCDPAVLEDNYEQAKGMLLRMEERLVKKPSEAEIVKEQFNDFIARGVYSEITEEEEKAYIGPKFYVTVHEVVNENSISTPVRLVTHSSLKYKGVCVNDVWMKGPNTLNDIYGVQLRFRCYTIPLVCDMSKMYHSVKTKETERHIRRVLWRDLDPTQRIRVYGTNTVAFGDRPAAAISTVAVRKTAELYRNINPKAAEKIIHDIYVDDTTTGDEDIESLENLKKGVKDILSMGGFKIKGFITSGDVTKEDVAFIGSGELNRVLGIVWDYTKDVFKVRVKINLSKKRRSVRTGRDLEYSEIKSILSTRITKRLLLCIINSCYDPYGLIVPITVQMKIAFKKVCNQY